MIIDYDHNPALTVDQKLQSLRENTQMAIDEMLVSIEKMKQDIEKLKEAIGE